MALPYACNAYAKSDAINWHEAKPGVIVKHLLEASARGHRAMLARLALGAYSLPHAHDGIGHIYVLDGEFHDGERMLSPGDYCGRAPGVVHTASSEHGALRLVLYAPGNGTRDASRRRLVPLLVSELVGVATRGT
jgi:quercetin dioxygenase-like cupin family protein